jgi:predicted  nucleic acid-binding Zn-ribbon protein
MKGIRLRHLVFTGPNVETAELEFNDGLNIIFGASNTGKSFASKTILFMLGASTSMPETEEIAAYDCAWLGITLADQGDFTLYRATRGGHLKLFSGLHKGMPTGKGVVLREKHDHKRTDTVSHRLLEAIGLVNKWVVRDGNGKKDSLSIRLLSKYAVVAEGDIMSETSPVYLSGNPSERTFEQNLFKLLLTGQDDSAAVEVPKETERKAAKAAKIELVDELLAQIDAELGEQPPNEKETQEQLDRLDQSADGLLSRLQDVQGQLDELVLERRVTSDRCRELQERTGELELTLERFAKLHAVYNSDLQRLQSIEEGGYVLVALTGRDCPVCGAPPDAQKHNHASDEISMAHAAAAAEARKIEREQRELAHVVASLEAEAVGLRKTIDKLNAYAEMLDGTIQDLRPQEVSLRESYRSYNSKRNEILKVLDLYQRREKLAARRTEIGAASTKREGEAAPVGPNSTTVFDFGETVKAVLKAWKFPDADKVQFDGKANDITVGGKSRAANGKGVRAVLHAAFNVAVIVYCIENNRPHPGFLVLDTPLLTYREPLTSKHGDLSQDEAELKATALAEHFYKHLASLAEHVQIIVIENSDPPSAIDGLARIETFTGYQGNGRDGLLARPA